MTKINALDELHDLMQQPVEARESSKLKASGDRKRASSRIRKAPVMASAVVDLTVTAKSLDKHSSLVDQISKMVPLIGIGLKYAEPHQVGFEEWELRTRVLFGQSIVPVTITGTKNNLQICMNQGYAVGEFSHYLPRVGTVQVLNVTIAVQHADDLSTHYVAAATVDNLSERATHAMQIHHQPNTFLTLVERAVEVVAQEERELEAA